MGSDYQILEILPGYELCIQSEIEDQCKAELIEGEAEVFGFCLTKNSTFYLKKLPIYAWYGCKIKIFDSLLKCESKENTIMHMYLHFHSQLENMRLNAKNYQGNGPRVLITGPTDSGKSSLSKLLLNYAIRENKHPTFVDIDVGQGAISLPGTVGMVSLQNMMPPSDDFDSENPFVLHFGDKSLNSHERLYEFLIQKLAGRYNYFCSQDRRLRYSGCVINTCGWINGFGFQAIIHTATCFEVDVVVVINNEELCSKLTTQLPTFVHIVHLPRADGVTIRDQSYRRRSRDLKVQRYFQCKTFEINLPFNELNLFTFDIKLFKLRIDNKLINKVCSLVADDFNEKKISNIAGYVIIKNVNKQNCIITLISASENLPSKRLLVMDYNV